MSYSLLGFGAAVVVAAVVAADVVLAAVVAPVVLAAVVAPVVLAAVVPPVVLAAVVAPVVFGPVEVAPEWYTILINYFRYIDKSSLPMLILLLNSQTTFYSSSSRIASIDNKHMHRFKILTLSLLKEMTWLTY